MRIFAAPARNETIRSERRGATVAVSSRRFGGPPVIFEPADNHRILSERSPLIDAR